jgi:hypothetical protein
MAAGRFVEMPGIEMHSRSYFEQHRVAQIHVAGDVPKIVSNNRMTGTPEEYARM